MNRHIERHRSFLYPTTNGVVGQRTGASSTEHDVGVEFDAADSLMRYERTSHELSLIHI